MRIHVAESVWLDDTGVCSIEQLSEVSGLSVDEINDLMESGVIDPVERDARPPSFQLRAMLTVRTARRLRDDFELDPHGVALALTLLRRIGELQEELAAVRARLHRPPEGG